MTRFDEQTQEYREMLEEILSLFIKKGKDYGTENDHYQNLRAGEAWGVPAWVGAYIRLCDKIKRLQKYFKDGKLENESVEDSLRDVIVYAGNAYMLWKELQKNPKITGEIMYHSKFVDTSMTEEFIKND